MRLPGHNGVFWVIPIILGAGIAEKGGSATFVSLIGGTLISFLGASDEGPFKIPEYVAMGIAIDMLALLFKAHMSNPLAGLIVGSLGNLAKLSVNYTVTLLLGVPANLIIAGLGFASVTHLVFGGLGGFFSALILGRLVRIKPLQGVAFRGNDVKSASQ